MNNWFQSDKAYALFVGCYEWKVLRITSGHCTCVLVLMGPWWCRRGIVQGGVEIAEGTDVEEHVSKKDLSALLSKLKEECRRYRCVYVEIRNFASYTAFKEIFSCAGFAYLPHYDVHLPVFSADDMFARMHDSKQRALKRTLAEGQTWREAATEDDVRAFYAVLKTLYRTKVKRPLPSQNFFCMRGGKA